MHLMCGLTCIVNDDRLVESLDCLSLQHGKVYRLLKTLLVQVVHPLKYLHSVIRDHPVHLSIQLTNKMNCMFEPHTCYCHIHMACTSVCYERKTHVLIIRKENCHSKKISCVLILLKYELYKVFLTPKFSRSTVSSQLENKDANN